MKYEIKKLIRVRLLWLLVLILLSTNIVLLNEYDKKQNTEDVYEYSKEDYLDFLDQIPEQTKEFSEQPAYYNHNNYLYRNLIKTEKDYAGLTGQGFKKGRYAAFNLYASYPYQIVFIILCAFMVSYQIISAERRKGFFLMLKSTKRGHMGLYTGKVIAGSIYMTAFSVTCDATELIYLLRRHGSMHFSVILQSSSTFRNCSYNITIEQTVAAMIVIHAIVAMFCVFFIQMLFSVFKRNEISLAIYAAFFVAEWFLSRRISISSGSAILAAVNPFYQSMAKTMFGNYLNVNIFGFPVSQMRAGIQFILIFSVAFFIMGVIAFSYSFQTEGESFYEKLMNHFRSSFSGTWHTESITAFEFRKVMFHEKRIFVAVIFTLIIIGFGRSAIAPLIFTKAEDAEYHRLVQKVQGRATKEKLTYISKEREKLDDLVMEMESLGNSVGDQARMKYLNYEYERRDGGLSRLESQRDTLLQMKDKDKYFFDEAALTKQFSDYNTDLLIFLISGIALVLTLCGLEGEDTINGMYPLLNTTEAGKGMIRKKKKKVVFITAFIYYLLWNIPDFISYIRIDKGKNIFAPLTQLTSYGFSVPVTELYFFIILALIRLGVFATFTILLLKITIWFRSPVACGIIGILAILITALILRFLRTDIVQIMVSICAEIT